MPGVRQIAGSLDASGLRVGIVASRYNRSLSNNLVTGAVEALAEHGASVGDLLVTWVPGAYEVPSVIELLAASNGFDALVGVGVVIQGETSHARLINSQVSQSLAEISRRHAVPVLDGIVPGEDEAQAVARAQAGRDGRGWYLGCAAIEMARVFRELRAVL